MTVDNSLEKSYFENEYDDFIFTKLLELNTYIKPIFVSREEFESKKEFLEMTEQKTEKLPVKYNLFLPKDIKKWEIINIIEQITKITWKWEISKNSNFFEMWMLVKYVLVKFKKEWKIDKIEDFIKYISNYVVDPKFIEEIKNESFSMKHRWIIKEIKSKVEEVFNNSEKEDKESNLSNILDFTWSLLKWWLDDVVNKNRNSNIFDKMETYTKNDLRRDLKRAIQDDKIVKLQDKDWVFKEVLKIWNKEEFIEKVMQEKQLIKIYNKNWETEFELRSFDLNEKPRKLKDAIKIKELKEELKQVRKTWNIDLIAKKEIEASNAILNELSKYPYQDTENWFWYQPNKILEYKEIYCIWFSILWHIFLNELWIKHNFLDSDFHSCIWLEIENSHYYFDSTYSTSLVEFSYGNKNWKYTEIVLENWRNFEVEVLKDSLLSWIYNNYAHLYYIKWISLFNLWDYSWAKVNVDKVLVLAPKESAWYTNKWEVLEKLWKSKLSKLYAFTSNLLKWNRKASGVNRKNDSEKLIIESLIEKQDYEWLRLYLLNLEEQENITN